MDDRKRPKYLARKVTLARKEMARTHLLVVDYPEVDRPQKRQDCEFGPRPCPFVSCRHHLYLETNPVNGSITIAHGHAEVDEIPETCALDVASRGEHTLEELGSILAITRERLRQLEARALRKVKAVAPALQLVDVDAVGLKPKSRIRRKPFRRSKSDVEAGRTKRVASR